MTATPPTVRDTRSAEAPTTIAPDGPAQLLHCADWSRGTGLVELHWIEVGPTAMDMRDVLGDDERERLVHMRVRSDQDRFILGAVLLRFAASGHSGISPADVEVDRTCRRCSRPHGRPVLAGSGLSCSVSHSHGLVMVALAGEQVGVDVEDTGRKIASWEAIDLRARGAAEQPSRNTDEFLRRWTGKEAVLKLTGEGLSRPMSTIRLAADDRDASYSGSSVDCRQATGPAHVDGVHVATWAMGRAVVSVAFASPAIGVRVTRWAHAGGGIIT